MRKFSSAFTVYYLQRVSLSRSLLVAFSAVCFAGAVALHADPAMRPGIPGYDVAVVDADHGARKHVRGWLEAVGCRTSEAESESAAQILVGRERTTVHLQSLIGDYSG